MSEERGPRFWQTLRGRVRVPVIRQDSELECGAAALTMVLNYYGRGASLPEVHERCNVGRDGANARDIATAGRGYGLRVTPSSVSLNELEQAPCPAILHWGFGHFVVLESFAGANAVIVDPGVGRRKVSRREMSEQFTGIVLVLSPGENFDRKPDSDEEPAWRVIAKRAFSVPGLRAIVVEVLGISVLLQVLGLSVPVMTKLLVDRVLPLQINSIMTILLVGILVILATVLISTFLRGLLLVTLQAKLDAQLMAGFFEHVLGLPFRYFQERASGDLLQRLSSNVEIRNTLSNQVLSGVLDGTMVAVYAVILVTLNPVFGFVAIWLAVLQAAALVLSAKTMNRAVQAELTEEGKSQGFLVESLSGVETLKALGAEDRALGHWIGIFAGQIEASMRRGRLQVAIGAVTSTIQRFAPLILLWVAGRAVLDHSMSLGSALALVSLAQLFLTPLATLVSSGLQLQQVGGHLERIAQVLRAEQEQDLGERVAAPKLRGRVEFDNVSFRYEPSGPWVIKDFSLSIEPGMRVAVVGATGSGKSTLAKLLLGLYEPEEGEVRLDDTPLSRLDLRSVRAQCGVVMQSPTVFNASIRRNIALHDPSLSMEDVQRAADAAELSADIAKMPMGFDTIVAEGGSALSGGQRQRLALARALVRSPRLLVLDEATSSLDVTTEARVADHLRELKCTCFVIAHRLSTVRDSDLIVALDGGVIAERGTHEELMRSGGVYAELVREQLKGSVEGASENGDQEDWKHVRQAVQAARR